MKPYPYLLEVSQDPLYRRISVSGFFKVIGRVAITALATAEPTTAVVAGGKEAVRNLEHHLTPSHRAFELILNGMEAACVQLIQQEKLQFTENEALLLSKRVENQLKELAISIAPNFFEAPQQLPAIQELVPVFVYWLEGIELAPAKATAIGQQLPKVFFETVIQEWFKRKDYYQPVAGVFDHPFEKAWEEEYHRERYYEELRGHIYQPALKDARLTLKDLYIKPYFLINNRAFGFQYGSEFREPNYQGNLHDYLSERLIEEKQPLGIDKKQRLIFLLGQPGQGKSSFCTYLSHQLLTNDNFNKKLYLVRLRDVENNVELIKDPFKIIKQHLKEEHQLKVKWKQPLLLILDGLDELYMSNGLTNEDLSQFYKALENKIRLNKTLTILLTSRHHYLNIDQNVDYRRAIILKLAPFSLEQQKQWLENYKTEHPSIKLTTSKLEKIHQTESLEPIRELIEQPILLHLIAKADMEIDDSTKIDRATIYKHLFDKIMNRDWAKEQLYKYRLLQSEKVVQKSFRCWLQEIAFTIYNSPHEYINIGQLKTLPSTKSFHEKKYIQTTENLADATKDLLVAFYFKKVEKKELHLLRDEQAIEFLHKSLQEYLTVEYIWNKIVEASQTEAQTGRGLFKLIFDLFHKKGLNENMKAMLVELIEQEKEATREATRVRLKEILPLCLKHEFLYSYDSLGGEGEFPPSASMENCFKSFWLLLVALAGERVRNRDLIQEEYRGTFGKLLRLFGGNGMELGYLDLRSANLSDAKLRSTSLMSANLMSANLMSANLISANLMSANLISANLMYVNLRSANLSDANLRSTSLMAANLMSANLMYVNLMYAKLVSANLSDAKLMSANLRYADLSDANLDFSQTNDLHFFQTLQQQNCLGVEALMEIYQVDPSPHYEDWDSQQTHPYYLIRKK